MPTTKDSVFRVLAEQEIKKNGLQNTLTSDAFKKLIFGTVILEHGKTKATYTWYDDQNGVIAEYETNNYPEESPSLPRLGKVTVKNARKEYLNEYNKKTRHYHLRFGEKSDGDIIKTLDNCPNIQDYIRRLIRSDIARRKSDAEGLSDG